MSVYFNLKQQRKLEFLTITFLTIYYFVALWFKISWRFLFLFQTFISFFKNKSLPMFNLVMRNRSSLHDAFSLEKAHVLLSSVFSWNMQRLCGMLKIF